MANMHDVNLLFPLVKSTIPSVWPHQIHSFISNAIDHSIPVSVVSCDDLSLSLCKINDYSCEVM